MSAPEVAAPTGAPPTESPPLRVAYVCRVLWDGGVQRVAIAQTEALRSGGIPCDLFFLRAASVHTYALPTGTRILEEPGERPRSTARGLARSITGLFARHRGPEASVDLDLLWRIRGELRSYDVVVYNDQYAGVLGAYLRLTRGQPYLLLLHELYPAESVGVRSLRPLAHLLDWLMLLLAPRIMVFSPELQRRIERDFSGRTFRGAYGTPPAVELVPATARERRRVLSLTVWDRGRHPESILALARLRPEFRFIVAGQWADSEHRREFEREAIGHSNVVVTGPISEDRRLSLLRESLIYLRLGYGESGPGMGGMEALANGCLVIANRGLGLSGILTAGEDGFVTESASPLEVASVLDRIDALSPGDVDRISAAARALALRHSWAAHGPAMCQAVLVTAQSLRARRRGRAGAGTSRTPARGGSA